MRKVITIMKRKKKIHLIWKIRGLALAAFALGLTQNAAAQRVGLKTNALYWAAASPNIGMEFRVNRHITFNFEGAYNRIDISKINSKALVFNPEMRYWLSARPQAGHFIGIAGVAADYDITIKDKRHKGDAFGAGLTYGYSFVLSRHWSLETTIGAGAVYRHEKSFAKGNDEPTAANVKKWQAAPLKAGVTFVYIIK